MYTVQKIDTPDRGPLFAVGAGDSIVNRWVEEDDAKENCTFLNGGEAAEKKLAAAEKKAEEAAKKADADYKARASAAAAAKPKAAAPKDHEDDHKPRAHAAKAKQHVKRMAPNARPHAGTSDHAQLSRKRDAAAGCLASKTLAFHPARPNLWHRVPKPRPLPASSTAGATARTRSRRSCRPHGAEDRRRRRASTPIGQRRSMTTYSLRSAKRRIGNRRACLDREARRLLAEADG